MTLPAHESYLSLIPEDPGKGPCRVCVLTQYSNHVVYSGLCFPSHRSNAISILHQGKCQMHLKGGGHLFHNDIDPPLRAEFS
jgi:hypothetical protein